MSVEKPFFLQSHATRPARGKHSGNRMPYGESDGKTGARKRKGKRFVNPVRLGEADRKRLIQLLEKRGIGDVEGRALFVAAMEYDLAECREAVPGEGASRTEEAALPAEIRETASALAQQLQRLAGEAQQQFLHHLRESDPFQRTYGPEYLQALGIELKRLGEAAQHFSRAKPKKAQPSEAAGRFIRRAAAAYRDCFEAEPAVGRGSDFIAALRAVASVTGISIPLDVSTLRKLLR